ncbi:MAG TPA: hypothetical protein VGL19_20465 [Polyangiaceae bacterium]
MQLSLDGTLIGYNTLKTTNTVTVPATLSGESAPQVTTDSSNTTIGVLDSGAAVTVGYGASPNILLGLRTQLTKNEVSFLPRLEILFEGDRARPFLAGMVGIASHSSTVNGDMGAKDEVSSTNYLAGGSLGVHAFVSDTLSIDPMLTFEGFSGSGTSKHTASMSSLSNDIDTSADISTSGVNVMFTVGLSAWIGGRPSAFTPVGTPRAVAADATGGAGDAGDADESAEDSAAGVTAEQVDPNWVEIKLPQQRRLYLQKTQHAERKSVTIRFTEPRAQWELVGCAAISVPDGGQPQELRETGRVETGEQHSVSGKIALRALTLLATTAAHIRVCNKEWAVSDRSRRAIQEYLDGRASNPPSSDEDLAAPSDAAPSATAPSAAAPSAPAAAPTSPAAPTPAQAP